MFCNNCGSKLADNATFCGNCGTPVTAGPAPAEAAPAEAAPAVAAPVEAAPAVAAPVEAAPEEAAPAVAAPAEAAPVAAAPVAAAPVAAAPVEAVPVAAPVVPVAPAPVAPGAPVAPATPQNQKKFPLIPVIIAGAAFLFVMLAVIVVAIILINRDTKIDLNEFVNIEYTGYDTAGKATFNFDYDKFNDKYGRKIRYTSEGKLLNETYEPEEAFQKLLSAYYRNGRTIAQDLSNGDTVEFEWKDTFITTMTTYFKVEITETKMTATVSGLEAAKTVDVFEGVEIEYSGIAPYAVARVNSGNNPYSLNFRVDNSRNLSNGDTITVTTSRGENLKDYLLKNYGVIPTATSKTFTVSGLAMSINKPEDISSDFMAKLQQQADATNSAYMAKDITSNDETLVSSTCIGYYLLTSKSQSNSSTNNQMIFVYRNVVHNTHKYFKKSYSKDNVFYSFCYISNLTILPDGSSSVDLSSFRYYTGNSIKFSSSVGYRTWWYSGFQDLDSLKNQAVTRYIDRYDYFDKIDPAKAGGDAGAATAPSETEASVPSESSSESSESSETSETTVAEAA